MFIRVQCGIDRCGNQILKTGHAQRILCNQVNIIRRGIVIRTIQSVRIGKMGVDRTDFLRFLIH